MLTRVHGGAVSSGPLFAAAEPSFADRSLLSPDAKPTRFRGTIATCSVLVAAELADHEDVQVLPSGGRIRGGDLALSDTQTVPTRPGGSGGKGRR